MRLDMSLFLRSAFAIGSAFILGTASSRGINILTDPGFESATPFPGAIGGWALLNGAAFSQDYPRTGVWCMKDAYTPSQFSIVICATQFIPATPGSTYLVSGWGLIPSIPSGAGLLLADFLDAGQYLIGGYNIVGEFNSATPLNTWTFGSDSYTAPANAAYIAVSAELFNGSPGDLVYYDDLSVIPVPEPSSFAPLGLVAATVSMLRHRRLRS